VYLSLFVIALRLYKLPVSSLRLALLLCSPEDSIRPLHIQIILSQNVSHGEAAQYVPAVAPKAGSGDSESSSDGTTSSSGPQQAGT